MQKRSEEPAPRRRISCVSYLNSIPFIYGLKNSGFLERSNTELSLDIPSVCGIKMLNGVTDIGLLPSALLPKIPNGAIVSPYGIAAEGPVLSVMLFSNDPIESVKKIVLDYQSRTSVLLARILAAGYWKINPIWTEGKQGFENSCGPGEAILVIGDRALERTGKYSCTRDLSEDWFAFSGLPFIFALWVSGNKPEMEYLKNFNDALRSGLQRIPELTSHYAHSGIPPALMKDYLENRIQYTLNERHMQGLELFLKLVKEIPSEL